MLLNARNSSALRLVVLVAGCLSIGACLGFGTIRAGTDNGSPAAGEEVPDEAASIAAFTAAYSVFTHPRCLNCHPAGNAPLQGDDSHPHAFRVQRGADGNGVAALRCTNCHQAANVTGDHMPPGAPFPAEAAEPPFKPRWHLPSRQTPLVFEGRTAGQLCRQLKDHQQNGGLSLEQLVHHVAYDPLVLWGWNPGYGRSKPALTHAEFVEKITEWVNRGASCPE